MWFGFCCFFFFSRCARRWVVQGSRQLWSCGGDPGGVPGWVQGDVGSLCAVGLASAPPPLAEHETFPSPPLPPPARLHMVGCKEVGGEAQAFSSKSSKFGTTRRQLGVPCWRARAVGVGHGGAWGAPPSSAERGVMVALSVPGGCRGAAPCHGVWGHWCHSRPRRRGQRLAAGWPCQGPGCWAKGASPQCVPRQLARPRQGDLGGGTPLPASPAPSALRCCLCSVLIDR